MIDITKIEKIQAEVGEELKILAKLQKEIKTKLSPYMDEKKLKGNDFVYMLGEIYAKTLLEGKLANDETVSYDFIQDNTSYLYSVKARKLSESKQSWKRSSNISKIEGEGCPHFLVYILFEEDYQVHSIYHYPWETLIEDKRFNPKGKGWTFTISPQKDLAYRVYPPISLE